MTGYRPKYPKRDANDKFLTEFLEAINYQYRGLSLAVWDTSPLGGETLDRLLWFGKVGIGLEIKLPSTRNDFTDGERAFMAREVGIVGVVTNEQEILDLLDFVYPLAQYAEAWYRGNGK